MYLEYLKERENVNSVINDTGFATYSILEDSIYLQDVYVIPKYRKNGAAKKLLLQIIDICKKHNKKGIYTSVDPKANEAHKSLEIIISQGFKLSHIENSMIYFYLGV